MESLSPCPFLELAGIREHAAHSHDTLLSQCLERTEIHLSVVSGRFLKAHCKILRHIYVHRGQKFIFRKFRAEDKLLRCKVAFNHEYILFIHA